METNFFFGCKTSDEVRNRYDELSRVFKLANKGESKETISTINDQYDKLMMVLNESKPVEAVKEKASVAEMIAELQGKIDPAGLHLEICGTWLWITGKTYQVKDTLKELGFRYSANKLSWYYRKSDHKSGNQEPIPLEMIREKYGISEVALMRNFLLSLGKDFNMTTADLKLRIFRQIDALEKSKLEELYGVLINYINGQKDISDWEKLSENQKLGIFDTIAEIEVGKGIQNKVVLDKFRKKYSHV